MANQEIISYIKRQLSLGVLRSTITENLKKVGWSDDMISESFDVIISTDIAPIMQSVPQSEPEIQPEQKIETQTITTQEEIDSVNSPYSSILSVLLVISLFIITNGIYSDIRDMNTSTNKILSFEGLFVIPFLLAAFLLHSSFKNDKKRFAILSYPYFIISAWMLLRLLWKVGENIWNANNAFGVYIVLGMVVVVLTGVIIFVQRYIKQ